MWSLTENVVDNVFGFFQFHWRRSLISRELLTDLQKCSAEEVWKSMQPQEEVDKTQETITPLGVPR